MVDEFCASLGRFVMEFARVEHMVRDILVGYSKISAPTGRAIYSGTRLKTAVSFIRRIHAAEGLTISKRVDEALVQANHILEMRDRILHQGFDAYSDDTITTSNWNTAHLDALIRVDQLSIGLLEQMTADLRRIQLYLIYWGPGSTSDLAPAESEPQPPWLYKPPQPQRENPKN